MTLYLAHHGIKGQKWGVRRTPEQLGHVKVPKNTTHLKGYSGDLYFISEKPLKTKTLEPRIPSNFLTKHGYEDTAQPRVCFSNNVGKCLTALSSNVSGKNFYVYKPDDVKKYKVFKPNEKAVPDSKITNELWVTEPVNLITVGKIKCTGDDGSEGMKYKYGNNTAELYNWNYEWIKKK